MNRATWNPATDPTLPLDTDEPTEWDVVELFEGTDEDLLIRFNTMRKSPHHRFRAITRRIERARKWFMLWPPWGTSETAVCPLMLGTRITTQAEADEKLPQLAAIPARWRFVEVKPSEEIDLRHAYAFGGKPVCGGCGHRHGSDPSTGEINNRCWHGSQGLCPCRTWRMPIDLVEIAGGTGPEQLRLVQALAQQVLDAQGQQIKKCGTCGGTGEENHAWSFACEACDGVGDIHSTTGPALAIVQADVCGGCAGTGQDLEDAGALVHVCIECNGDGTEGRITTSPRVAVRTLANIRAWNQQPVGWLP